MPLEMREPSEEDPEEHHKSDAKTFHSIGVAGGRYPLLLKKMLRVIGYKGLPMYHTKRVPRAGGIEWKSTVDVYDSSELRSTHHSPVWRSTRGGRRSRRRIGGYYRLCS